MANQQDRNDPEEFAEESESLLRITLAPTLWALHFAFTYGATAIYCAKWGGAGLTTFRLGAGILTALVLAAIVWLGWRSWRQWDANVGRSARAVFEDLVEEEEPRHQFLGHAAFLLSIISFVGVVYTSLPVILIGSCR